MNNLTNSRLHPVLLLAAALSLLTPGLLKADWLDDASKSRMKKFQGTEEGRKIGATQNIRGKVTVRRIHPQCPSDWDNDQTALPYFFYQIMQRTEGKYPCYVNNEGISLLGDEIFDYPVIYFTSHFPFTFTDEEVQNLKKYLARGGTLWLDDCTGSGGFTDSVPPNVQRIAPGVEVKLMLRESKDFFDLFNIVYKVEKMPSFKEQYMQPFQAAIINGRPAIQFCPDDYGCVGWEISSPPTTLNPLGNPAHADPTPTVQQAREECYQLTINWLFYILTH